MLHLDAGPAIDAYQLFRLDRQAGKKKGGGLLVYVKNYFKVDSNKFAHLNLSNGNIKIQILNIAQSQKLDFIECL